MKPPLRYRLFNMDTDRPEDNRMGFVPVGGIILWSGSAASVPTGWAICDGTNGTPDLTGRFVIGTKTDSGATYDVGDTGGVTTHNHTYAHKHLVPQQYGSSYLRYNTTPYYGEVTVSISANYRAAVTSESYTMTAFPLTSTGRNSDTPYATNDNTTSDNALPPYYALCYIQRIA